MHEISDVFLNNGVRSTVEGKRSAAERLSSYSNLNHNHQQNHCDSGFLNQDFPCDCVACSYLEFKQITGLGQTQPVANNYTNSTCSSSGILGQAPPYFACLNRVGGGMDSSVIYSLGLGMQVNIKRTDGRVHTAVVSGINWDTKSITVEWFERNETKGKEVDLESIVALNPHIVAGKHSAGPVDSMANVTANLNVMPTPSNPRQTVISDMRPPAE
ncbi:unnamed protein product [Allacma fusca]|nr:unnamed protein product [Allacma fusca]